MTPSEPTRQPPTPPPVETPEEASVALLYHLHNSSLTADQRTLLVTDYAARRRALEGALRAELDELVFASHLPGHSFTGDLKSWPLASSASADCEAGDPRSRGNPVVLSGSRDARLSRNARSDRAGGRSADGRGQRLPGPADIAVLTVLPVERQAVCDVFEASDEDYAVGPRRYHAATIQCGQAEQPLRVMITSTIEPHNVPAAIAMGELTSHCRPDAAFLVGVAAGIRSRLKLGDVVIPQAIHYYDPSRLEEEGELPRHDPAVLPPDMKGNLHYYNPDSAGLDGMVQAFIARMRDNLKPPRLRMNHRPKVVAHNAILASGAKLIADGKFLPNMRDRYDQRIVAADQEAWGFASACQCSWAVFRGVSDYGDPAKHSRWQYLATATAALSLRNFLERVYVPPHAREL